MARVSAPFGVKGWVKVHSYAEPPEALLDFPVWQLGRAGEWHERRVIEGRAQSGPVLAVRFEDVEDRDQAALLRGLEVAIAREALADLPEGEYYWADLIGLTVVNADGSRLGAVERLMETGANDVLVVRGDRERLIPFIRPHVVRAIDLEAGELQVDWDADF
ncbi:ribosome maturation factor RimM [Acidihalobacter prosperus]